MISGSTRLVNRFGAGRLVVRDYFARTITATGKQIADMAKENMYPGHFEDTSLSKDTTAWEQTSELGCRAHVPTIYASGPEFGTLHMAPRPALRPAVEAVWPEQLERNWRAAPLLPPADPPGDPGPAIDKDGNPL